MCCCPQVILLCCFQILRWWHDFGITLTLSIFATLAFESPILGIEKAIFGRGDAKPAPKKQTPESQENVISEPVAKQLPEEKIEEIVPSASGAEDPSKA